MGNDRPCCAADALRRIRQVKINGVMTGITMLDEILAEVRAENPGSENEIRTALMKRIKVNNYVPKGVEEGLCNRGPGRIPAIDPKTLIQKNLNR